MGRRITRGCLIAVMIVVTVLVGAAALAFVQARRTPAGSPQYVALGSSFAAGAGLGPIQSGSPLLCARTINGYPQQLARMLKIAIVDMSCGGAVTAHLLRGGQFFQGPQIRVINRATRLVTITVGGNDIGYVADLSLLAARHSNSLWGWLVRQFWSGPKQPRARDYAGLRTDLVATLQAIRERAPQARIVIATYPAIVPPSGTCPRLQLTESEADLMRGVGNALAATTRAAAAQEGAMVVDMHVLGAAHNACSSDPWTRGYANGGIAPFHPTLAGAKGTAQAIAQSLAHQQL